MLSTVFSASHDVGLSYYFSTCIVRKKCICARYIRNAGRRSTTMDTNARIVEITRPRAMPQQSMWDYLQKSSEDVGECAQLRVYDLFCGGGGFTTGATLAGHRVVMAADCNQEILSAHAANHPTTRHVLANLPADEALLQLPCKGAPERWHLHGSPPCTNLSVAKWDKTDVEIRDAMDMVNWYLELAMRLQPTSWSFEQVAVRHVLDACREFRKKHPTRFAYAVVRCHEYGIPQMRKRVVGGSPWLVHRLCKRRGTFAKHMASIKHWTPPQNTHMRYPKWHRRNANEAVRHKMSQEEVMVVPVTGPGYTISCTHSHYWSNGEGGQLKIMTAREQARLQTFPDSMRLPRAKVLALRVVGNAIPPRLATLLMENYENYENYENCEATDHA